MKRCETVIIHAPRAVSERRLPVRRRINRQHGIVAPCYACMTHRPEPFWLKSIVCVWQPSLWALCCRQGWRRLRRNGGEDSGQEADGIGEGGDDENEEGCQGLEGHQEGCEEDEARAEPADRRPLHLDLQGRAGLPDAAIGPGRALLQASIV